jgi:cytochrome c-type biogenesis protein CcmH/NrfG
VAVIVLTIVIALIWLDYRNILKDQSPSSSDTAMPFVPKAPNLADSGRTQPKILDSFGKAGDSAGAAPGLEGLITGLEEKVAADPTNVGRRILLAQTYKELGMGDKSLETLRAIQKEFPENLRAKLVLASVLSQRQDDVELKEALSLLEKLSKVKDESIKPYLVEMYEGDVFIRLKEHEKAMKKWKLALETMPKADNRYEILQKRVDELAAGQGVDANKSNKPSKS